MPKKKASGIFQLYWNKIAETPRLNHEEQRELIIKIKSGDQNAKEILALANQRLVVKIAKEFGSPKDPNFMDLIQEGNCGLMNAIEGFQQELGNKFSTYAYPAIRNAMIASLSGEKKQLSLDAPIKTDEDAGSLHCFVGDKKAVPPGLSTYKSLIREAIDDALSQFGSKARDVILLSFGLVDGQVRDRKEVAKILGIKKKDVDWLKEFVLRRLKKHKTLNKLNGLSPP